MLPPWPEVELEEEEQETHEVEVPSGPTPAPPNEHVFVRVWIGVSGAMDFTVLPGGTDVCTRNADGSASDGNWSCTNDTPEGTDFPATKSENASLVQGKAGSVTSGVQPANVRVKATFDYAVTQNLLLGGAVGYVAGTYNGTITSHFVPMHLEVHGTWLFGTAPLSRVGFAPFVQLAGGVGEYDSNLTIMVEQNGVPGARPVQAWHVGGPGFVAFETGLRYAYSARAGLFLGARATAAFGTSFFPAFGPDITLQIGF